MATRHMMHDNARLGASAAWRGQGGKAGSSRAASRTDGRPRGAARSTPPPHSPASVLSPQDMEHGAGAARARPVTVRARQRGPRKHTEHDESTRVVALSGRTGAGCVMCEHEEFNLVICNIM